MAKAKGGRAKARLVYPTNKPSKTGNKSGLQRSNTPVKGGKPSGKKVNDVLTLN